MDAAVMQAEKTHKTVMTPAEPLIMKQGKPKIVAEGVTVHYGEKQAIFPRLLVRRPSPSADINDGWKRPLYSLGQRDAQENQQCALHG